MTVLSNTIATFDLIGALAFLVAGFYGINNFKKTKFISSYWLVFAIAVFLGSIWALMVALEWYGIMATALDSAQQSMVAVAITAFAIAALLAQSEIARPE